MEEFENKLKRQFVDNIFMYIFYGLLIVFLCYKIDKQENRLDAHKEVIELQQKQINQLIIHCEYERNK